MLPPRRFDTNATDLLLRLGIYLYNNHCENWFPRYNLNRVPSRSFRRDVDDGVVTDSTDLAIAQIATGQYFRLPLIGGSRIHP